MTRFIIGLLLGLLLGIGGTAAFLITAGGGDYLVATSPRVRELEASLKSADQDRDWLRKRLAEANDVTSRLETRFVALSSRFEQLVSGASGEGRPPVGQPREAATGGAPVASAPAPVAPATSAQGEASGAAATRDAAAPLPSPTH